jgi:hypothetical protein
MSGIRRLFIKLFLQEGTRHETLNPEDFRNLVTNKWLQIERFKYTNVFAADMEADNYGK